MDDTKTYQLKFPMSAKASIFTGIGFVVAGIVMVIIGAQASSNVQQVLIGLGIPLGILGIIISLATPRILRGASSVTLTPDGITQIANGAHNECKYSDITRLDVVKIDLPPSLFGMTSMNFPIFVSNRRAGFYYATPYHGDKALMKMQIGFFRNEGDLWRRLIEECKKRKIPITEDLMKHLNYYIAKPAK